MRHSWITALRKIGRTILLPYLLIISLSTETMEEKPRLNKQEPAKFTLRKKDLIPILVIILLIIISVYIVYKTGALESTRIYNNRII